MNQTLIVIDIQDCFINHMNAAYSSVIRNVAKEVKAAIQREDHILFVEYVLRSDPISKSILYRDWPSTQFPTLPEITSLTSGYDKVTYVFKRSVDGGTEVVQTLREKGIPLDCIRVCGAYTGACVSETVQTMAMKLKTSEINLVKPALASYNGDKWNQEAAIDYMISIENVKLDNYVSLYSEQ